jgi:nucleotide-binding universal stress UspA family protein
MLRILLEPTVERAADRRVRARVLTATSGSAASANATAAAAIIATERDAELIVVHVRAPEVMRVRRLAPTIVHQQRLSDPHGNGVLSTARQVAWADRAFARVILLTGDPGPGIVSLARWKSNSS